MLLKRRHKNEDALPTDYIHEKYRKTLRKFNAKIAVMFIKTFMFGVTEILTKRLPLEDYFIYRKARGLFNMIYMIKLITEVKLTQRNEAKDKKKQKKAFEICFLIIDITNTHQTYIQDYTILR